MGSGQIIHLNDFPKLVCFLFSSREGGPFGLPLRVREPLGPLLDLALHCAHRATTASSWGLCEQEGHLSAPRPLQACSLSQREWGLIDLPLRVSRNPDAKQAGRAGLTQRGEGLVYIVCLVGTTGKPARQPKKPNERKQRTTAGKGNIGYLTTEWVVDSMTARIFLRLSASNSCP